MQCLSFHLLYALHLTYIRPAFDISCCRYVSFREGMLETANVDFIITQAMRPLQVFPLHTLSITCILNHTPRDPHICHVLPLEEP